MTHRDLVRLNALGEQLFALFYQPREVKMIFSLVLQLNNTWGSEKVCDMPRGTQQITFRSSPQGQ